MNNHHFLLLSFPFQSHINPTLRLATKLIAAGAKVTVATTDKGLNNLKTNPSSTGLSYVSFTDGYHDSDATEKPTYFQQIKLVGSLNLNKLLITKAKEDQKVDFLIYGIGLAWAAEVARELHVPSAFFFVQCATSFLVVHHFLKSDGEIVNSDIDLTDTVEIPGLPLLRYSDIPVYLLRSQTGQLFSVFHQHIQTLEKHPNPIVLINTFDGLEQESINMIPNRVKVLSVGPLIPDGKTEDSDRDTCLQWLDSKPEKSVVYVAFGSFAEFQKKQKEEMFHGLNESGHPYLWVIRNHDEDDDVVKNSTAENGGLIVSWCSQVEVLKHGAIGCFVTHCGWNSMIESVLSGVSVVGCPQFADQMVNATMAEKVWGNGVKAVANGDGVVGREEIKRCLEMVMGGGGEIKKNCEKLKNMAMEAVEEAGSSQRNLKQLFESLNCV